VALLDVSIKGVQLFLNFNGNFGFVHDSFFVFVDFFQLHTWRLWFLLVVDGLPPLQLRLVFSAELLAWLQSELAHHFLGKWCLPLKSLLYIPHHLQKIRAILVQVPLIN